MKFPKNADLWLPAYVGDRLHTLRRPPAKRLWVALTDHFEPCGNTTLDVASERVAAWEQLWPAIAAAAPVDAAGRPPCFTMFYPQEEYQREIVERLAVLCRTGIADMEVHLHHFDDNRASFTAKVKEFTHVLHEQHGMLHEHDGRLMFGFIHGNWALDNSHPAGFGCGVVGELQALSELGCYADFTMPSLPSPTQSRILNKVYWTTGDPARPRGFDTGVEATPGGGRQGDLLMITGPTGLRYRGRLLPRLETGELAVYDLPTPYRVKRWLELAPRVGEDIFLKLYGHTAREDNAAAMLGTEHTPGAFASLFRWVAEAAATQELELHWASAYQMFARVEELMRPGAEAC